MLRRAAVLLTVLWAISLRAALGPGAEVAVAPPANAPLPGLLQTVASSTDGTDFLAVWRDETAGRDGLYATIVSENGALRPAVPQVLFRGYADADAVWTGNSYLVSFTRYLEPSSVARLSRDGVLLAPPHLVDLGGDTGISALAWNGQRVLAVGGGSNGAAAALLDAEGNVVRSGIAMPGSIHTVAAAAAGDAFIVVWSEFLAEPGNETPMRVRAVRISNAGDVSAPVTLIPNVTGLPWIDAASDGDEVGVIVQYGASTNSVLHRYTIDASLAVDAKAPLDLPPFVDSNVSVVPSSRGFLAAYYAFPVNEPGYELRTIEFGETGYQAIDIPQLVSYTQTFESNGRAIMGFWGLFTPRAAAFDTALTTRTSEIVPFAIAPAIQAQPAVASRGTTGVVAWTETGVVKLRRVNAAGAFLDAEPLVVTTASTSRPAVVFTGQVWLVAWTEASAQLSTNWRVHVQRVSPDGTLLGEPIKTNLPMGDVAFASNGNVTALVASPSFRREGIRLVRFSADGTPLDTTPIVLTDERSVDHPAIASNGSGFLVAWSHSRGQTPHVDGKRLDASGNPIEATPIEIVQRPEFSFGLPAVASNGTDYVVAYVRYDNVVIYDPPINVPDPAPVRVYTKRVLASGVLADTTAGQDGTFISRGTRPAIAFDGTRYVATFTSEDEDTLELSAVPLDALGRRAAPPRLLLRAESHAQEHGLATIGGAVWSTYSRVVPELASVQRVFLRGIVEQQQPVRRRGARN